MPVASERVWVVVPAYNEGPVVATTVTDLLGYFANVIVVDDCSTDGSGQLALGSGAHVARHPLNLGQGAALATGIAYALRQGAEAIVTFDADGQHSAADARAMVQRLDEHDIDTVLVKTLNHGASIGGAVLSVRIEGDDSLGA
ncbi:MAG: glycosyltransferase family 2 protein, partial [Hyphomicrobiales bacterium]